MIDGRVRAGGIRGAEPTGNQSVRQSWLCGLDVSPCVESIWFHHERRFWVRAMYGPGWPSIALSQLESGMCSPTGLT